MLDNQNILEHQSYDNTTLGGSKPKPKPKTKPKSELPSNTFIAEGAYGCTFKPGLDCDANINTNNKVINKIQSINFSSQNELKISDLIKKKIKNYKKRFVTINKSCIVNFNTLYTSDNFNYIVENCDNSAFKNYSKDNISQFMNTDYIMFYMNYIEGGNLQKFFSSINDVKKFYNNFTYSLYYLLNSIYLLNKCKIIHNDLHINNILYDIKKNRTLIIDFGLAFKTTYLYKNNLINLDIKTIKKYFFNWQSERIQDVYEKRFVSFILDYDLTLDYINLFLDDIYNDILKLNKEINIYNINELNEFYTQLKNFYYKFLPEFDIDKKYENKHSIIYELLPHIFKYNDLHSLSYWYIYILKKNKNTIDLFNYNNINLIHFIIQLFKKVLYPNPLYKLSTKQFISIISFIFKYCKDLDDDSIQNLNFFDNFNKKFTLLLTTINYDYNMFFNNSYAYVDFNFILNKNTIYFIKNLDFYIK